MKTFFICWGIAILLQAAWFAWKSVRRMLKIARQGIGLTQMSLAEIEASQGLDRHPAFGDPFMLMTAHGVHVHPLAQFFRRWLLYFPMAWMTNIIYPVTWVFALPAALVFYFLNHFAL
jgi:hypothetical protein